MLAGFIGITVIILFIIGMYLYARNRNLRKASVFHDFAKIHELNFYQIKRFFRLDPEIKGDIEGHPIHIYEKIIGSGKSKRVHTIVQFTGSPFDFDFTIGKEGFISKIGKVFGFKDIEFQDDKFDKVFLLKSSDESKFRAMMNYRIQARLTEITDDLKGSVENEKGILRYIAHEEIIKEDKIHQLERVMMFMIDLQKTQKK